MQLFRLGFAAVAFLGAVRGAVPGRLQEREASIISSAGDTSTIPGWFMQSSTHVSKDIAALSQSGADVSSWYRVGSHGTVMAGLLENNVYNDETLFFSENLKTMVDHSQFTVPWWYREELTFSPQAGQRYFLQTNGITSKADLYVNGVTIASKTTLKGAYGGQKFDITDHVTQGKNVILIRAYPTTYLGDFALGFVDWNPYPADNGTGVWREVTVSQTGAVSLLKPRVITDYTGKTTSKVTATIKVSVRNSGSKAIAGTLNGMIKDDCGGKPIPVSATYSLKAGEVADISLTASIDEPKIWWPKLWGAQPLYTLDLAAYIGSELSDKAAQRTFGIRHVSKTLNSYNDTAFQVNGQYFQVLGAGYGPDVFLRLDEANLAAKFSYVLDQGLNTIRLEGKQEQPILYDLADRMGLMILAGWECCDKWEGWTYNDEVDGLQVWVDDDYDTAEKQMDHEAYMMQGHASMLAFLVGSDFYPDDRATKIYVDKLMELNWDVPIIASAGKLGFPELLGSGGMKMDGPYDWVSPNYWYGDQLGAAFGFGSELGAGAGTPEHSSLKKFLSEADMDDLWTHPNKDLFHMSTNLSSFYDRSIYNAGLYARYGAPTSLANYLIKAQVTDYEATRAEYEAYAARRNAARPATGVIYWMLNNAWPSLHWNFFDYYLKAAGSYFGAKMGSRPEHVVFEYGSKNGDIWLINHTLDKTGARTIAIDVVGLDGKTLVSKTTKTTTKPNFSQKVASIPEAVTLKAVSFLRLVLSDTNGAVLSRNVYWLSTELDTNDWDNSTWYNTPVTKYADYTSLQTLKPATLVTTSLGVTQAISNGRIGTTLQLENKSKFPAFFIRLELQDAAGADVAPAFWTDNYVTLWPGEVLDLGVQWMSGEAAGKKVQVSGWNVGNATVTLK